MVGKVPGTESWLHKFLQNKGLNELGNDKLKFHKFHHYVSFFLIMHTVFYKIPFKLYVLLIFLKHEDIFDCII